LYAYPPSVNRVQLIRERLQSLTVVVLARPEDLEPTNRERLAHRSLLRDSPRVEEIPFDHELDAGDQGLQGWVAVGGPREIRPGRGLPACGGGGRGSRWWPVPRRPQLLVERSQGEHLLLEVLQDDAVHASPELLRGLPVQRVRREPRARGLELARVEDELAGGPRAARLGARGRVLGVAGGLWGELGAGRWPGARGRRRGTVEGAGRGLRGGSSIPGRGRAAAVDLAPRGTYVAKSGEWAGIYDRRGREVSKSTTTFTSGSQGIPCPHPQAHFDGKRVPVIVRSLMREAPGAAFGLGRAQTAGCFSASLVPREEGNERGESCREVRGFWGKTCEDIRALGDTENPYRLRPL